MKKRDNEPMSAQPPGRGRKAILNPSASAPIEVTRHRTDPEFGHWVDYVWIVHWHVPAVDTGGFVQRVIPQPIIHLAAENNRLLVHGVGDTDFRRTLTGDGHVVGIAFRPAAFRAILRRPVSTTTRSVRPLGDLIDFDDRPVAAALLDAARADTEHVATVDDLLRGLAPQRDRTADELAELVALAEKDQSITRAEQLASHAGVGLRTLQRSFGEYIGIGPKWVIQRFRLLDVAQVANTGADVDWAATAAELGFADQAHLTRAFTALVGTPPASYARATLRNGPRTP